MPAMSLFDELADLWIKVQPDEREPHQWIYAVDDAWFHPENTTVQIAESVDSTTLIKCDPIFQFSGKGKPGKPVPISEVPFTSSQSDERDASGSSEEPLSSDATPESAPSDDNRGDRGVAKRLIAFIKEQAEGGLRYGVCFCSFEYLWKNIDDIDAPQNAVLFDIRHALGWNGSKIERGNNSLASGDLRDHWKKCLDATGMFGDADANVIMVRLGWYLHYSLKFAKIPKQPGPKCAIHQNHIQIVSSAVSPNSGRADALSDFSAVQQAIWSKLPKDDGITPDLFAFSPMPKDEAMKTGLGVFNNSFKHAADWGRIKIWFLDDIAMVYCHEQAPRGHFNTGPAANNANWKWKSWLPHEVKPVSDPLYKTYADPWIKINDLLRMLSHSGVREFRREWSGFDDKEVLLPTTPGFVFVILLIEFINNLGPKEGRQPPVVKYALNHNASDPRFQIKVTLQDDGVRGLLKCYSTGKKSDSSPCGTASQALRALGNERKTEAPAYKICGEKTVISLLPTNHPPIQIHFCDAFPIIEPNNGSITITLKAR